jgi:heme-degrading monooxygenase HmoA
MFNLDDYETVEERLVKFWKEHADGIISTELLTSSATQFIVKASIYRTKDDIKPWTTGLAEETVQGRGVNSTSALENCETSAIGRALANAGYATKGKRASREEMSKVAAKQVVQDTVQQVKAKMADTSQQYVPIAKADDPWTTWEAPPVQTLETAVEMVQQALGGTAVDESCVHGARIWKTGTTKTGNKQWGHWRCPAQATRDMPGGEQPCDPIWYEIAKDGTWQKRAQ